MLRENKKKINFVKITLPDYPVYGMYTLQVFFHKQLKHSPHTTSLTFSMSNHNTSPASWQTSQTQITRATAALLTLLPASSEKRKIQKRRDGEQTYNNPLFNWKPSRLRICICTPKQYLIPNSFQRASLCSRLRSRAILYRARAPRRRRAPHNLLQKAYSHTPACVEF